MNETKQRALQIHKNLGIIDGQKHIRLMLYFIEPIGGDLYFYWSKVDNEFQKIK